MKSSLSLILVVAALSPAASGLAQTDRSTAAVDCSRQADAAGKSGDAAFLAKCLGDFVGGSKTDRSYRTTTPDAKVTKQLRDSSDNHNDR